MRESLIITVLTLVTAFAAATAAPSAHEGSDCGSCHTAGAFAEDEGVRMRGVPVAADRACLDCHKGASVAAADVFHASGRRDCTACHDFHEPDVVRAGAVEFRIDGRSERHRDHCASCHRAGASIAELSPGHVEAAALYHVDTATLNGLSPSDGCLRCHERSGATAAAAGAAAPRFATHASHPFGEKVRRGEGDRVNYIRHDLDPRLPLFDDRIECQTCHALAERTEKKLVAFDDPYALCLGCHAQDAAPRARLASAR